MSFIPRLGYAEFNVLLGQSVIVGSFGSGQAKIYYASTSVPALWVLQSVVSGGSVSVTPAAATAVRVEAGSACDVEYDFGTLPALTTSPFSVATGITAKPGGGQSGATPLTGNINRLTTTATAGDSALLPPAVVGRKVSVYNAGAASANIFPQTGESTNSGAANAAFAVAATKGAIFECVATGLWNAVLSA